MGVSFASVNRWENGQEKPSLLAWKQLTRPEILGIEAFGKIILSIDGISVLRLVRSDKTGHTIWRQRPDGVVLKKTCARNGAVRECGVERASRQPLG